MNSRIRPLWLAAALAAAGCAAPAPGPLVGPAVEAVDGSVGRAPRWREGGAPTEAEEARVRDLLSRPLTGEGAVDVALVRSRRFQGLLEHALAEALSARAEAAPGNPVAELFVRWPHGSGGPVVDAGIAFGLIDLLRAPGRRDGADLEARIAALEAAEGIVAAVHGVRAAWVEAVAARQLAELDAAGAEAASISADLADRQQEAGTLPALDADRLRAFRDDALVERDRSRNAAAEAAERLVRALGVHGAEARPPLPAALPPLPPFDPPGRDLEATAVARRLDLEIARTRVVAARLAAGLAADARVLPDLEAGVAHERDSDGSRSTGPGVSVPLPLSPREAALSSSARAAAREAEDRLHDLAVRIRSEAREAAGALASARAVADRYASSIVPRHAAMVEEAQLHYNGMLLGVHDLLMEKREELRARRGAVEALRDAWLAGIRLDEALGGSAAGGAR